MSENLYRSVVSSNQEKSLIAIVTMAHCGFLEYIKNIKNDTIRSIYYNNKKRRSQYSEAINSFIKHGNEFSEVILLECLSKRFPRYLRGKKTRCAISRNLVKSKNKGIQEFINIYNVLKKMDIPNEQKLIKLTGRYSLNGDKFIDHCSKSKADVVAKIDSDLWGERGKGIHTFLFCAKKRILMNFGDYLLKNEKYSEFEFAPVEWTFYKFIVNNKVNIEIYQEDMEIILP
jgi:hypothetical protein